MSDKPKASAQPLTPDDIKDYGAEWDRAGSWLETSFKVGRAREFIPRLLATIDALNDELHLLREGRRKLLESPWAARKKYVEQTRRFDQHVDEAFDAGWAAAQAAFEREK